MGASSCGGLDTLNGGTIVNSTMLNGQITNSTVQSSEFVAGKVTNSTIDLSTITNATMTGGSITSAAITTPTVMNPTVTGGTLTGSTFDSGTMQSLVKIDDASAFTIANALASLQPDQLASLAKAILAQLVVDNPGNIPADKTVTFAAGNDTLTTMVAGDRTGVLGKPDKWVQLADGVVPVYAMSNKE